MDDDGKCHNVIWTSFAVLEDDVEGSLFNLQKSFKTELGHVTTGMTVDEEGLDGLSVNFGYRMGITSRPLEVSYRKDAFGGPLKDIRNVFVPAEIVCEGDTE